MATTNKKVMGTMDDGHSIISAVANATEQLVSQLYRLPEATGEARATLAGINLRYVPRTRPLSRAEMEEAQRGAIHYGGNVFGEAIIKIRLRSHAPVQESGLI